MGPRVGALRGAVGARRGMLRARGAEGGGSSGRTIGASGRGRGQNRARCTGEQATKQVTAWRLEGSKDPNLRRARARVGSGETPDSDPDTERIGLRPAVASGRRGA